MKGKEKVHLVSRIKAYLARREEIVAAYLFGSLAQEIDHAQSDIDVALLLSSDTDQVIAFDIRLQVAAGLETLCQRPADVVILNHAPPLLRFQVIQRGQLLMERNRTARCLFESRAMSEYYDFKPYLDFHFSHLVKRIEEEGLGAGYPSNRDALEKARQLSERLEAFSADSA